VLAPGASITVCGAALANVIWVLNRPTPEVQAEDRDARLLAKDLTVACYAVGFDPYVGFYHQPRFGRPAGCWPWRRR